VVARFSEFAVIGEASVLCRMRDQDDALLATLDRAEAVAAGRIREDLPSALSELGCRLRAHAAVSENLLLRRLRDCGGDWARSLAELEAEHDALRCGFAALEGSGTPSELSRLAIQLRQHLAREVTVLREMGTLPSETLASMPAWWADELYELSGGWVDSWPEKWLG